MTNYHSFQQNKYISYSIIAGLFLLACYSTYYYNINPNNASLEYVSVLGLFSIVQFIYTLYSWYKVNRTLFDAYTIFTLALYAFNVSQPILEALGLSVGFRRLWGGFGISYANYFTATYFALVCLIFFHIGALLSLAKQKKAAYGEQTVASGQIIALRNVALLFCLFSAFFYLRDLLEQMIIVTQFGYVGIYEIEYTSRTSAILGDMFPPSLLALYCSSLLLRKNELIMTALVFMLLFLPPLYIGGRSNAMIVAAIFLIVYATIRNINLKKFIMIAAASIALLFVMNIVGQTRASEGRSSNTWREAAKEADNPIISTIQEMGWSMYPLALSIEAIPEKKDYSYGTSYFWAMVSCIPNIGFWSGTHPGKKHDPGTWLNKYSSENYGVGYSMTAGVWNEFGPFGFLLMLMYGFIFCKFFSNVSKKNALYRPIQFVFAILFLWYSIKFVRNSFDSFTRQLVFYMLPLYIITQYVYQNNKQKWLRHVKTT